MDSLRMFLKQNIVRRIINGIKIKSLLTIFTLSVFSLAEGAETKYLEKKSQNIRKKIIVQSGDTLSDILTYEGISANTIYAILGLPHGRRLAHIVPGTELEVYWKNNEFFELRYNYSPLRHLSFQRKGNNRFSSREIKIKPEVRLKEKQFRIHDSLFLSGKNSKLSDKLLLQLVSIFDSSIDFVHDIHKGDSFSLVYETYLLQGKQIATGNILAVRFINQGKVTDAVRYTNKNGHVGYYSFTGKSLEQSFSRTPVDFTRISSGFSYKRLHPIRGITRPHRAIDYAAPINTIVKVTGDGKISFLGYQKGYGKVIFVKHKNNITTVYAHLNRYKSGLKRGSFVKKSSIIGYVGMTGYATGPHLHYEFRVKGIHKNPLTVKLPQGKPIPQSEMKAFKLYAQPFIKKLQQTSNEAVTIK